MPPTSHVAVLKCMDARFSDAHVIRNAGGVVTDDAIRSLTISQRLLGAREIILIHHSQFCVRQRDGDLAEDRLSHRVGT